MGRGERSPNDNQQTSDRKQQGDDDQQQGPVEHQRESEARPGLELYDHNRNTLNLADDYEIEQEKKRLSSGSSHSSSNNKNTNINNRVSSELEQEHDSEERISPIFSLTGSDRTSSSAPSHHRQRGYNNHHHNHRHHHPAKDLSIEQSSPPGPCLIQSDLSSSTESTQLISSASASSSAAVSKGPNSISDTPEGHRLERERKKMENNKHRVLIDMFGVVSPECPRESGESRHDSSGPELERAGLLPALLGRRRASRPAMGGPKGACQEPRRFSLQLSHLFSRADERRPSLASAQNEPPHATTVAGVGGTVTTVTHKKRKTAPLPRLVAKNGQVNLFFDNIDRRQYFRDLFVTMIDIRWRYNLAAAAFGFVISWLFFACIWYMVLFVHDDLNHENDPNWSPCIVNVNSFAASLLFSIETQSTLGFGSRIISVECPGAIVIFCMQLIFGVVIECLIVGMVFAKLTRPTKRSQTIMYSKCATVCLREDQLCLTFRVGDVRSKSHIIGATIRASLVSQKITREGEIIPFCHNELNVTIDNSNSLLLIWPVTIVHVIDETSPFYSLSAQELINFKFELITVLEGTVESTGQSIQVRSSYLPSEVKWGYRFEPIVSAHGFGRNAQTIIDYNKFNRIIGVDTPMCSARDYYAQRGQQPQSQSGTDLVRNDTANGIDDV